MSLYEQPSEEGAIRALQVLETLGDARLCGRIPEVATDHLTPALYRFNAWLLERHGWSFLATDLNVAVQRYRAAHPRRAEALTPDVRGLLERVVRELERVHGTEIHRAPNRDESPASWQRELYDARALAADLGAALSLPATPGASGDSSVLDDELLASPDQSAPSPDERLFRILPGKSQAVVVTYCDQHVEFPEQGLDMVGMIRRSETLAAEWILQKVFGDDLPKLALADNLARHIRYGRHTHQLSVAAVRNWAALQP